MEEGKLIEAAADKTASTAPEGKTSFSKLEEVLRDTTALKDSLVEKLTILKANHTSGEQPLLTVIALHASSAVHVSDAGRVATSYL